MPSYKKQHFLPSVYLRRFAVPARRDEGREQVWRIDAKARRLVNVRSQGFGDYFYSSKSPQEVEGQFQVGEDFFGGLRIEHWQNGMPPNREQGFGLLLIMLDLHIRNRAYAKTTTNNFADYLQMSATVKYRVLWGQKEAPPNEQAIVDAAVARWRVRLLRPGPGNAFLTSDNPSLMILQAPAAGFANLIMMPLSPTIYGVAYDAQEMEFVCETATASDESLLTQLQIAHCSVCVYASQNITDAEWDGFNKQLVRRKQRGPVEGPGLWGANLFRIPAKSRFDFLRAAET